MGPEETKESWGLQDSKASRGRREIWGFKDRPVSLGTPDRQDRRETQDLMEFQALLGLKAPQDPPDYLVYRVTEDNQGSKVHQDPLDLRAPCSL